MNLRFGIAIKLLSVLLFALMSVVVRYLGDKIPLGQVVFFRSACALLPILAIYGWRGGLSRAFRTRRPFGHVTRGCISVIGMFLNFAALARLPLVDATAISFAGPAITVALAAVVLKERVRTAQQLAVATGFGGVVVMLLPYLDVGSLIAPGPGVGVACALSSAFTNSGATIQTRRLTDSESTSAIVFYFSLICALISLVSLPFAWYTPTLPELAALVSLGVIGGVSHILLTECFRHVPASVVAPFDYVSLLWAFFFGYVLFGETPGAYVYIGAAIVIASGLFVVPRGREGGPAPQCAPAPAACGAVAERAG